MAINKELLEKVKRHILEEPRRYDQQTWGDYSRDAPCGTAACIAGWTAVLAGDISAEGLPDAESYGLDIPDIARRRLGLSIDEADVLFDCAPKIWWPEPFKSDFEAAYAAKSADGMAKAAAAFIDHIIATGKVPDAD